jgi:hypothetical protein
MNRRVLVQVVAVTVVAVFAIGIWSTGQHVQASWLKFYSTAVFAVTIVLALWDHWAWHLPWVQKVLKAPRDLRGTWKGTLTSFWNDPGTGKTPAPKTAFAVVRQSASEVKITLLTDESSSRSSLASLSDDGAGATLAYTYLNRPAARVEHRSRMHNGSVFLEISGKPAVRMHGRYWTDRDSRGELDFSERKDGVVDDYEQAVALFGAGAN